MESISNRIKEGLTCRDMKQTDLVNISGISKGALSSYISGTYEPKQRNIYKIAKALDVNEAWLMGFDVPMERDYQNTLDEQLAYISGKILNTNNTLLKETILRICDLDEKHLKMINDILNAIEE